MRATTYRIGFFGGAVCSTPKVEPCQLIDRHLPKAMSERNQVRHKTRMFKSELVAVSQYRTVLAEAAREWSSTQHAISHSAKKTLLKKEEYAATRNVHVAVKGWAHKHSLPSVQFSKRIKRVLIWCFNQKPHMSPDQALGNLKGRPEFANDVFVEYFVTPTRIKGYFGRLKKHRDDNLNVNDDIQESFAGEDSSADSYKNLHRKEDIKAEIKRRNLVVAGLSYMNKSQLVAVLVQNDSEGGGAPGFVDPEEDFDMEEAIREDESGGLDNTEGPQEITTKGVTRTELEDSDGDDGDVCEVIDTLMTD